MTVWLICAAAGCIAGLLAPVGARFRAFVPVPILKRLFAGVLLVLAARLGSDAGRTQ